MRTIKFGSRVATAFGVLLSGDVCRSVGAGYGR